MSAQICHVTLFVTSSSNHAVEGPSGQVTRARSLAGSCTSGKVSEGAGGGGINVGHDENPIRISSGPLLAKIRDVLEREHDTLWHGG